MARQFGEWGPPFRAAPWLINNITWSVSPRVIAMSSGITKSRDSLGTVEHYALVLIPQGIAGCGSTMDFITSVYRAIIAAAKAVGSG
jgi:hypothetical protein